MPECTGEELTKRLLEQIKPFKTELYLNKRVEEVHPEKGNWIVKTNNKEEFMAPNIIIAGGVGSFEPRKISLKECEKFAEQSPFPEKNIMYDSVYEQQNYPFLKHKI